MKTIGVLALQGDFAEHIVILEKLGAKGIEVRASNDLKNISGLIIPGGESTTIGKLAIKYKLIRPIQEFIKTGKPVWGTCAGMILLAETVIGRVEIDSVEINHVEIDHVESHNQIQPATKPFFRTVPKNAVGMRWIGRVGKMDIVVERNAFGRQIDSFEEPVIIEGINNSKTPFNAVFIRAPIIQKLGKNVQVLARLKKPNTIVAARQNNLIVTSFHPELTRDTRMHEYFLKMV